MARKILAFDLFGTILDTSIFSQEVRRKQLEYAWLLTIMGKYLEFEEITRRAIKYVFNEAKSEELEKWRNLKAFLPACKLGRILC